MIKRQARNKLFDSLHRGAVVTCVGVTLYGCFLLGLKVYKHFTVIVPQRKLKELEESKHLLAEGRESIESSLQDTAPELKL